MLDYKRILVPVDGSDTSRKALNAAIETARQTGGQLRLIHSVGDLAFGSGFEFQADLVTRARDSVNRLLEEAQQSAKSAGVQADTKVIDFVGHRLGQAVADEARDWKADLIVVGTHGRRGVGRVLLGSGAEQIIRMAPTPVLVIRADEQPA